MNDVLAIHGVSKTYPNGVRALSGVTLSIKPGECLALLGPNGAGKTTLIKILTRLLRADVGTIDAPPPRSFGVALQDIGLWPHLTLSENLDFVGRLYGLNGRSLESRRNELLAEFDLAGQAVRRFSVLSEGQKRRVNLVCALIHHPEIVVLDEPSLGLDVHARLGLWKSLEQILRNRSISILLSTHDMEEAERLGDRIAILDRGKLIAFDSPSNLISAHGNGLADAFVKLTGHAAE